MNVSEHFLASYYRRLFDAEIDRGHLNRVAVLTALPGLAISALGHWFDLEWVRCLGAIPLIIAFVCGASSLIQSVIIHRLLCEIEGANHPPSLGIPMGFRPSAQGCAPLGKTQKITFNPEGVAPVLFPCPWCRQLTPSHSAPCADCLNNQQATS